MHRTGPGTGQVWILHGAAVYLRAHGAFRGAPEACRLRGAAIARRRRLCRSCHTDDTVTVCVQCVHSGDGEAAGARLYRLVWSSQCGCVLY